jgi:hypothetical protein
MREVRRAEDGYSDSGMRRADGKFGIIHQKAGIFRAAGQGEGGRALTSQSLTDDERVQIERRIAALEVEHQDLDDIIARLSAQPDQDQLQLRRFKKRKLVLKDSISRLKILLVPDIPA